MPFVGDYAAAVEQITDNDWVVLKELRYQGNRDLFVVPVDSTTDFASVPRPLIWFIPRYGKYTPAAILHDYLWRVKCASGEVSWSDADGLFRRVLRELGVSFLRYWFMWAAVRLTSIATKEKERGPLSELFGALAIAIPGIAVVIAPALVILAAMTVFWFMEAIVWLLIAANEQRKLWLTGREPDKPVSPPKIRLRT